MNKKENINQLIDEAINSVEDVKRAAPMPFLLTRVYARLNKAKENMWEKATGFIGRPAIAIPGLILLIVINVTVVIFNRADPFTTSTEQSAQPSSDEFSDAVATIYDI
ncbi:MAG: hypothetical protein ABI707_10050 [Ferruginibacter sp.]